MFCSEKIILRNEFLLENLIKLHSNFFLRTEQLDSWDVREPVFDRFDMKLNLLEHLDIIIITGYCSLFKNLNFSYDVPIDTVLISRGLKLITILIKICEISHHSIGYHKTHKDRQFSN